jgi:hypothetical protein
MRLGPAAAGPPENLFGVSRTSSSKMSQPRDTMLEEQ